MRVFVFLKGQGFQFTVLLVCFILYSFNSLVSKNLPLPFFKCYFNDLLAMPAMLAYINIVLAVFIKKRIVALKPCILAALICGGFWELGAVFVKPSSVCDPLDILCYMLGSVIYFMIQSAYLNKEGKL